MKSIYYVLFSILTMISCTNHSSSNSLLPEVNLSDHMNTGNVSISEEISHIEYIALETSEASLFGEIQDICLTDESIFIVPSREGGVYQFDRRGNFRQILAPTGQGPGETTWIMSVTADEEKGRLYINQYFSTLVYTLEGEFVEEIKIPRASQLRYSLKEDLFAEIGTELIPMYAAPEMFGMGIFSLSDDTIAIKNDVFGTLNPDKNEAGFIANVLVKTRDGYLAYLGCNDTIFKLTAEGIFPAYFIQTGNSLQQRKFLAQIDYRDYDFNNALLIEHCFETETKFYIKASYKNDIYLFSYDKTHSITKGVKSMVKQPPTGLIYSVFGIENKVDEGFPIWANKVYPEKNILLHYLSYDHIMYLIEAGHVKQVPPIVYDLPSEANPIIILHYLT